MSNIQIKDLKIGVFMGGPSCERDISLKSGKMVFETLKSNGFIVIGTGPGPFPGTTKVWYNPIGANF